MSVIILLVFILGLTSLIVWIIDKICFLIFYHYMTNGDIRRWNDLFSPYSREFHITEKGINKTIISTRYECLTIPTIWIYRESYLSVKNILGN